VCGDRGTRTVFCVDFKPNDEAVLVKPLQATGEVAIVGDGG
jgi:hypothetical protein